MANVGQKSRLDGPVGTLELMLRTLPSSWSVPINLLTFLSDIGIPLFGCLFPTGRFLPRWSAWLALGSVITWGIYTFVPAASEPINSLALIIFGCILLSVGGLVAVQVYRYRRISNQVQRQQAKWVFFGIGSCGSGYIVWTALSALLFLQGMLANVVVRSLFNVSQLFFLLLIPFSIGFAILRYRLWDIDLIINRTLVYGLLTLSTISLYALIVGTLGTLLQAQGNFFITLLAAGLIAVLFQPLRAFLQRGVNRLLYGQRDEPYLVIARLSQRLKETLEPDAVLSTIVETVAQALKLPYAAILWKQEETLELAASYGQPMGELLTLPLTYQEQTLGQFQLAPRSPGEAFTPADRRLLDELARQAGLATHAVRLTTDLQKARERLVLAREEERRRLRRDLHDCVGPTLASLSQRIDTAGHLVPRDPDTAIALLDTLKAQVKDTIANIRRVVYALRPPVLDELGLVSAISEHVMQLQETNGLHISLEVPTPLSDMAELSAAVEVAAYRIALEALTNVVRHAQAQHCFLRLVLAERFLYLSVSDDGCGLSEESHAGVGITSMRERVAELGGEFMLTTTQGRGTCVQVRLPLKS
ncbi:GAF domain-containing sensor histidine kinase [Ktedonobacter robiniae]|uniref:Oxygen sensor histidine kinase NreB n=1 Tax=Ktedonobacter robiniae TaxID=2778365 RepID=A0ABQ3V273_9CHLR|nr:sensor histidine kinase [Ktedonobacter robiniae]GHO58989.1 hypothetical protein KSB_74640 [Ktedonobacter robiniae]